MELYLHSQIRPHGVLMVWYLIKRRYNFTSCIYIACYLYSLHLLQNFLYVFTVKNTSRYFKDLSLLFYRSTNSTKRSPSEAKSYSSKSRNSLTFMDPESSVSGSQKPTKSKACVIHFNKLLFKVRNC